MNEFTASAAGRRRLLTSIGLFLFISLSAPAQADILKEREVKGRKVFICSFSDRDTFSSAADGCRHFAQKHLAGYTYKEGSAKIELNGAVKCICTKAGSANNDQTGVIMKIRICPQNASEYTSEYPQDFEKRRCLCYEGYKAENDKCVEDECKNAEQLNEQQKALKEKVKARLQELTNEENAAFAKDPKRVYDIKVTGGDSSAIITPAEIAGFGNKFGLKRTRADGLYHYSDKAWEIIYGHVIERLTAKRVEKDKMIKQYLSYIRNVEQTAAGGKPDFIGKGELPATVKFDITTAKQAEIKKKTPEKKCWNFITYERLIILDDEGDHVPVRKTGLK